VNTTKAKSKVARSFALSLVILLLTSIFNWGIITGWGDVEITPMTMIGDDGNRYSAFLYVPETATTANPAPAIIMAHGISGNARNHESWAMEFARRGFVALSVDWMGNGDCDYDGAMFGVSRYPALEQYYDYLQNMTIVDQDNIIASGHSMGCDVAFVLAAKYNPKACLLCNLCPPPSWSGEYIYSGNILYLSGTADKSAAEATYPGKVQDSLNANNRGIENFEFEKLYGSFEEGNAVLVTRLQDMIHEGAFVNSDCIEILLNFAQDSVGHENVPNYIEGSDQYWLAKDGIGLVGIFAFLFFLMNLAVLLIENVPYFTAIRQPIPRNIGLRGKGLAISVAAAIIFPLVVLYTGSIGIYKLIDTYLSKTVFLAGYGNYALATVIGLNLFGFAMLMLFKFTDGKAHNAKAADYGLTCGGEEKINVRLIGRAFLLAVLVVSIGWTYLAMQRHLLGIDIYCLFFGLRPIVWSKFTKYIPYFIVWIICFVVASIGMNVERRLPDTGNEKKDMVIACVVNTVLSCIVILVMVIVENSVQIAIGSNTRALATWGIDISRLWGMPVGMQLAGIGQTYLYRKTGSVWVGAFTMGIVCALCCVLYGQFRFM